MKIDIRKLSEALYPVEADPFDLTGLADRFEVEGPPVPAHEIAERRAKLLQVYREDPGGVALALGPAVNGLLGAVRTLVPGLI